MKNICGLALAVALAFQIIGCGKNNNNSDGSKIALAPDAASCMQGQQAGYQAQTYGSPYQAYQWGNNYNVAQNGFCGCGAGQIPACNPGGGMVCVPQVANYAQYGYNGSQFAFNGYNQGYNQGYNNQYAGNNCSTGVGQACQVNVVGSCGYGQCVSPNGGLYGICVN